MFLGFAEKMCVEPIDVYSINWALSLLVFTVPWFWGEVKGYSKLYSDPQAYGGIPYMLFSIAAFLVFTDFGIYWIHRWLHHPILYKRLHKVHIISL